MINVRHKGEGLGVSIEQITRGGGLTSTESWDLSENDARVLYRRLAKLYGKLENK